MHIRISVGMMMYALAAVAENPVPPPTLMAQPDKLLLQDAMQSGSQEAGFKAAKGQWQRGPDGLTGEELEADQHGAVTRLPGELMSDFIIRVDVRIDGAKGVSLTINDAKEHVARISLSPTRFGVRRDDHDHDGPDKAVTFLNAPVTLEAGTWHTIVLEMVGDAMVGTLDGNLTGTGNDVLFSSPKGRPGLTVAGKSATFRNFAVWSAKAAPRDDWEKRNAELPAPPTASAAKERPAAKKVKTEK